MDPVDNPNLIPIIGNNPIIIPKANVSRIQGPSIIPTIDRPILRGIEAPVVRGLEVPVVDMPDTSIKYPVVNVPTQAEFDAAVNAEKEKQEAEKEEKTRGLPDAKPITPPIPQAIEQFIPPPVTPQIEVPSEPTPTPTFTVNGIDINLPDPSIVATAGAIAVVTTATTMVANTVFNLLKNAAEPMIKEASKRKFKIKLKQVKPVLHYVLAENGHIDIFEYSAEGTRLVDQIDNVEQYLRDQVDINSLYEIENKIIIDDIIANKFTKEGRERFKSLFAPAKKIAKKLSSRLSF